MLHTLVDLHQFGIVVNKIQNFLPGKVIASIKTGIDLAHELKVFGCIHCPTVIAKIGGVVKKSYVKSAWGNACLQLAVEIRQLHTFSPPSSSL